jgi:restriction system protein
VDQRDAIGPLDFAPVDLGTASVIEHWKRLRQAQTTVALSGVSATGAVGNLNVTLGELTLLGQGVVVAVGQAAGTSSAEAVGAIVEGPPEVALAFGLLDFGERVEEGQVILAITPAWVQIITDLEKDPNALYRLSPREAEELVAGAYRSQDWQVTLTPRSGDGGVDIIATRSDVGAIRILDQVKLYKPSNLVPAHDVRAMWGVLDADKRASKAYVTTTSGFAPGVQQEFADRMPTRLELRDAVALRDWLQRCLRG